MEITVVKVVLVNIHMRCGGAERVMAWLANQLVAAGHEVTLGTWFVPTDDFYPLPPEVKRVGVWDSTDASRLDFHVSRLRFMRRVRHLARDADVVLSFQTDANLATLIATVGLPTPVVVSERSTPIALEQRWRTRLMGGPLVRRRAAVFVVQTTDIAERFATMWRVTDAVVIPNAPAIELAPPTQRENVILNVGRFAPVKDHATLIRAWARIASAHPAWKLRIIGEGPLRSDIDELIERLGVSAQTETVDPLHDIAPEYRAASIFAFPSLHEGFPNALLEAAASGCACVATNCPGGGKEILDQGRAGILVPVGDDCAMAAALEALINDPNYREDLGRAAEESTSRFTQEKVFAQWLTVLAQ